MIRPFIVAFALILMSSMPAFGQVKLDTQRLTASELEGFPESIVKLAQEADETANAALMARTNAAKQFIETRAHLEEALQAGASADSIEAALLDFEAACKAAFDSEMTMWAKDNRVRMMYRELKPLLTDEQVARYTRRDNSLFSGYFIKKADDIRLSEKGYKTIREKRNR